MIKQVTTGEIDQMSQVYSLADTARNTLLLDECVTRRVVIRNDGIKAIHSIDLAELGVGANDDKILRYVEQTGITFASRDFYLVGRCLERNVKVAIYHKGKAYIVKVDDVIPLGENIPQYMPAIRSFRPKLPDKFR